MATRYHGKLCSRNTFAAGRRYGAALLPVAAHGAALLPVTAPRPPLGDAPRGGLLPVLQSMVRTRELCLEIKAPPKKTTVFSAAELRRCSSQFDGGLRRGCLLIRDRH